MDSGRVVSLQDGRDWFLSKGKNQSSEANLTVTGGKEKKNGYGYG